MRIKPEDVRPYRDGDRGKEMPSWKSFSDGECQNWSNHQNRGDTGERMNRQFVFNESLVTTVDSSLKYLGAVLAKFQLKKVLTRNENFIIVPFDGKEHF
jgi:hypothetical protein